MILIQALQLISFFLGFPSAEASESFMLCNNWHQLCLTHALPHTARGATCDQADPNQQWRWVDGLYLQNVGSGHCVTSTTASEPFEMQACVDGSNAQRLICTYNTIIGSHRGESTNYLAMSASDSDHVMTGNANTRQRSWRVYDDDEISICNGKKFRENRKWWRVTNNAHNISSGLTPMIVFTTLNSDIGVMDSAGNFKYAYSGLNVVSVAPHALWGIHSTWLWHKAQSDLTVASAAWTSFGFGYSFIDFTMLKKGFVVMQDGNFCARLGITENITAGDDWNCVSSSGTLEDFSCGVTGCFGLVHGILHFRDGITSNSPAGTGWSLVGNPKHELFVKIAAGPIYELWAITSDGYPYKRMGICDGIRTGTHWELISNLLLKDVSFGIYGPVAIARDENILMFLNGSPAPARQREMDDYCTSTVPKCTYSGSGSCVGSRRICNARYTPKNNDPRYAWRCVADTALTQDGQVYKDNSVCIYTRHDELLPIALRYPVLGDFEKQLWMDTFCQNQDILGCSQKYFANYNATSQELVCRTIETNTSCPVIIGLHEALMNLTTGSCADNPLILPLASSQFSSSVSIGYHVKLDSTKPFCRKENKIDSDVYFTIDFLFEHKICAIATKGMNGFFVDEYRVSYGVEYDVFNESSLFGSQYVFKGNDDDTTLVKRYLPAQIIARWLRVTFRAVTTINKCIKVEVYGSSLETEATSCQYYKDRLSATVDGIYNIYPKETEMKKRVFCKGITDDEPTVEYPYEELVASEEIGCFQDGSPRAMPVFFTVDAEDAIAQCRSKAHAAGHEVFGVQVSTQCYTGPHAHITYDKYGKAYDCQNGKGGEWVTSVYRIIKADKLFWPLNTTQDGAPGPSIHGVLAVNVYQGSHSRLLAIFPNHCATNLDLCSEGLSIEFWLWFTYTFDHIETRVISSGFVNYLCRGFKIFVKFQHVCMEVHTYRPWYVACVGPLGKPTYWLHVLATWDAENGITLIVDGLEMRSEGAKNWQSTDKVDKFSFLRLGDRYGSQSNRYDVAIHSLTIWTRKLSEDEIEARFTKGYTLANEGESCTATCEAKGLACDKVMTANGNKVLQRLGFKCSSFVSYNAEDQAEPYMTSSGVCHGLFGPKSSCSCEASKAGARRLCRCERPVHGRFTEWTQWSFCSRTCGSGRRVRTRSCTQPAPRLGGRDCEGITRMHDDCRELPCGVEDGILHHVYLGNSDFNLAKASHIGSFPGYSTSNPMFSHIIEEFATKSNHSYYGERFTTYFIPPENGDYTFTMECPRACAMTFLKRSKVPIKAFDNINNGPRTVSKTITDLVAGAMYYIAVTSVYIDGSNEFKLGFQSLASGLVVNPITKQYLTWKVPTYQGVSRELWNSRLLNAVGYEETGDFLENAGDPDIKEEITSFEAGSSGKFLVQRLQTYFLATSNGDYNFKLTCAVGCYVFIDDVYIDLFHKDGDINSKWSSVSNVTQHLEGGQFYKLVVTHYNTDWDSDYVALGVTLPDGTQLQPIPHEYLWVNIPEKLEFEKNPGQKSTQDPVSNALDGSLSTCSMTTATTNPWFRLQSAYKFIAWTIAITNKVNSPNDLDDVQIKVANSDPSKADKHSSLCYTVAHIPAGQTVSYPCGTRTSKAFVAIWLIGSNRILSLCEVVVYGERSRVEKGNYQQGTSDGRVEQWQVSSSSSMLRHNKDGITVSNPYNSWCSNADDANKFLELRFVERRMIIGFITQGDHLEQKRVNKAEVQYQDDNNNWVHALATNNGIEFGGGVQRFKTTYYTKSLRYIPTHWIHQPCVRIDVLGKQWESDFSWSGFQQENTTRSILSGAASAVQVGGLSSIQIPRASPIELHGLNTLCLRNPKMCSGSFSITVKLIISDISTDGIIFSTSGVNTSIVGTTVLLKDSNLIVNIRTVSRIWKVSGSAGPLVGNTLKFFKIDWSYLGNIILRIEEAVYSAPYIVGEHMPLASDDSKGVITFGGVDLSFNWFSLKTQSYDSWERKRIHSAVDGWHTEWGSWGYCSKSCGNTGAQYRYRRCTNPSPKFAGLECSEASLRDTRACSKPSCNSNDGVLREVWMNKGPPEFSLINVFDGYASHLEVVTSFSLSYNDGPFAERLRTFLHAEETGNFEFRLSCAYQCELWISPNDEADDKVKILSHDGSGNADWSTSSTLIGYHSLERGGNYYIEVKSFDIQGARNHRLLTIKAPGATVPGTGFSLVRHKPDRFHGLGLESGAIPDGQFFARAHQDYSQFAYHGRLNGDFPSRVKEVADKAFIIDLLELHWIAAVVIQGYTQNGTESWVRKLNVRTRLDLKDSLITDYDGVPTVFFGNDDAETVKVLNLVPPMRSRYVWFWLISYVNDGCFRVDVIGSHAGNLAYLKETDETGSMSDSHKAVDGFFKRGLESCAHPKPEDNMIWWLVDFVRPYYIGEVFLVGRKDCCWERMHDIQIRIGNSGGVSSLLNPQCGGLHSLWEPYHIASLSVYCEPYGYGRYLTIAKEAVVTDISLAEVAVFQIENDTIFSNWSDCSVTCGHGFQQRHAICIKPYYCKSVEEIRPCFAGKYCEILMQNCGQLHALGRTETGTYKVRPNPSIENDIYIYCDHETDDGGWLVLQRRSSNGTLNMTKSWDMYRDGFGNNGSTEFWIGNKYLSELTNYTTYEIMFLFTRANGSILKKTKCDGFNVSTEEENYRLHLGTCEGPDAEILEYANESEFSTWDKDNGFGSFNCANEITGWWFGSCDAFINNKFLSCFGLPSCDYDIIMMIKPKKVDGGWTHWSSWETCDKPCGGGNSSRVRSCTHPPPTGGGADCEGPWNETLGCNTRPCPDIEVNMTIRFTDETWTANLLQPSSTGFQELVIKIKNNILALYDQNPTISVVIHRFREGSVISDVTILYEALDDQQLVVLYEDLDQDGLLNQDMPVVYNQSEIIVTEVLFGPPQITEFGNTSSTSIYIKWQPPVSTILHKLLGYRIFYKESNDTSLTMLVQAVEKNVREIEIPDLKFYTNYSVRVCAFSSAGNGVPTAVHHILTDEYIPMAAPVIMSAYNLSSTSLNISWLPVDLPSFRGIPTGYILHYRIKTSDNTTEFLNTTIDDYLVKSINISDLMKYTEYEISMTATTVKGQGIRGESVYIWTDEDVPSYPPSNITLEKNTSTSLLISWSAIPQEFVHGVLRGYVIEYWPVDHISDSFNATVEPWVTEVELTNLIRYTNYSIKFAGMTSEGVGNWSEVILQTAEDVPEWGPMNLTGFNVSETEANVSWNLIPEKYRHGIIIAYRVHYQDTHRHSGSVTVPGSQRNIILSGLFSYTLYNISVAGITNAGEGWNRTSVLVHTNPGAPSREPWDLICSGVSSYTISLNWHRFTPDLTGSIITGYFISYKAVQPPHPLIYNVTFENFKYNYIAKGLKGYTSYSFQMYVFNPWGRSDTSTVVCATEEGRPLASPKNFIGISKVAPDKVHLKWDTVPDLDVAGIRRGYTITYRKTNDAGDYVEGDEKKIDIFDPLKTEIVIEGLDFYCGYSFTIRVFNSMFYGDDSQQVYAETCNCLENFYMNWCSYMPYVNTSESGIFPTLINSAIYGVCGNCSEYGEPTIHWDADVVGASAKKSDMVTVRQSITDQSQINFPLTGRKDAKSFVPIVDSPGSVFVTKKPSLTMAVEFMFFDAIISTLPLLGLAVVTATLAGVIMWFLETEKNIEEFPSSFNRGAREGFWWAFISMTTVGYGDRTPTTLAGRIFSIMWTLYGLVITGILVGNLTSALTASVVFTLHEVDLYQAQIAVIENSSELKLGLMKGAYVNKDGDFSDILSVLHAVEVESVEGALLDMYVVANLPELQKKGTPLKVKAVIENPSAYGMVLSGHATKLRKAFLQYFQNNGALVARELEKYTNPVKKSDEGADTSEQSGEDEINVLAPDSPVIKTPLLFSFIALGVAVLFGLIAHFTFCKRLRKSANVQPVSSSTELCSALGEHVSNFCENSLTSLSDMKQRHRYALLNCTQKQFHVNPKDAQFEMKRM